MRRAKTARFARSSPGVNPQHCKVVSFKEPDREEQLHDYLWRIYRALPAKGEMGVFNRSHYEDVIALSGARRAGEEGCAHPAAPDRGPGTNLERECGGGTQVLPAYQPQGAGRAVQGAPRESRETLEGARVRLQGPQALAASSFRPTTRCCRAPQQTRRPGTSSRRITNGTVIWPLRELCWVHCGK